VFTGGGVPPGTISVKFYVDVNGWPRYPIYTNIAENFNRLSRVHERYRQTEARRQTDRRAAANSESERSLTKLVKSLERRG